MSEQTTGSYIPKYNRITAYSRRSWILKVWLPAACTTSTAVNSRRVKKMAGVGDRGSSSPSPVLSPDRPEEPTDRKDLLEEVRQGAQDFT